MRIRATAHLSTNVNVLNTVIFGICTFCPSIKYKKKMQFTMQWVYEKHNTNLYNVDLIVGNEGLAVFIFAF